MLVVMLGGLKVRLVPPTITLWSELGGTEDAVGVGAVVDEVEEEGVPPVPVAAAWKAANLSPALMAKTMPDLQCVLCRQYAQMGVAF